MLTGAIHLTTEENSQASFPTIYLGDFSGFSHESQPICSFEAANKRLNNFGSQKALDHAEQQWSCLLWLVESVQSKIYTTSTFPTPTKNTCNYLFAVGTSRHSGDSLPLTGTQLTPNDCIPKAEISREPNGTILFTVYHPYPKGSTELSWTHRAYTSWPLQEAILNYWQKGIIFVWWKTYAASSRHWLTSVGSRKN